MLHSMTGYGKGSCVVGSKTIVAEIKSLNSKQLDLTTKVQGVFRNKELEIRNIITQSLTRGKVDFLLYTESADGENIQQINTSVFCGYCTQIKQIAEESNLPLPSDWFSVLLRMPDVFKSEQTEVSDDEWLAAQKAIQDAIAMLVSFRVQEGNALEKVFTEKIHNIFALLLKIEPFEKERVELIRNKIKDGLENLQSKIGIEYDSNRLEQEMIYYIEKLDVNEEKSRLRNHLKYFLETMQTEEASGKKLGFIAQEIGREINTLGSKSNHSEMQKIVVKMKDELEQIKEQVLNAL